MALMPCMECGQRFKGDAENVYAQHYSGDQVESYRLVLCDRCTEERMRVFRAMGLHRDADGEWVYGEDDDLPKWQPQPQGGSRRPKTR